jgi:hypothetical protein
MTYARDHPAGPASGEEEIKSEAEGTALASTVTRPQPVELSLGTVLMISVEDLIARLVRLVLQLAEGILVAPKYAHNLIRMLKLLDSDAAEPAWLDHRLTQHPTVFREACAIALELIETRPHLSTRRTPLNHVPAVCLGIDFARLTPL